LREFAQDKQREIDQQLDMLHRNLRPINQQQLGHLNSLIEGSVSYVEQVNLLRTHLRNYANTVKSSLDKVYAQLEQLQSTISREDLSYEAISTCAIDAKAIQSELQKANQDVSNFDAMYRNLLEWQRLVNEGSKLLNEMQQMSQLTPEQQDRFDQLSRDIRADISSKSNKLDALPNHSVYAMPLGNIAQEVYQIRRTAEDDFINLQNRYHYILTSTNLYSRERIGRAFEYNISNPDESYRLLYERVQTLVIELHKQLDRVLHERRQEVSNTLSTPHFSELMEDKKRQIEDESNELISLAENHISTLTNIRGLIENISAIRDFPTEGDGQFHYTVTILYDALRATQDLNEGSRRLSQWLTDIGLTPSEEGLLAHLPSDDSDQPTDIYDWQDSTRITPDEFWNVLRGLYEKQRIRIHVTRVRR
jgi:hypothetical protein